MLAKTVTLPVRNTASPEILVPMELIAAECGNGEASADSVGQNEIVVHQLYSVTIHNRSTPNKKPTQHNTPSEFVICLDAVTAEPHET